MLGMNETPLRLLTLNIRHGGGTRSAAIVDAIIESDPDVIVLTEFRENASGATIRAELAERGWLHQASSKPPVRTNGVVIAARVPLAASTEVVDVPGGRCRWLECKLGCVSLIGVYLPLSARKLPYWAWLMDRAHERVGSHCMILGDFNTGKHFIDEGGATFYGSEYMDQLEQLGFTDAWRTLHPNGREFTWYSNRGNGFRLDYAWLSPSLRPALHSATHLHHTRSNAVSDHAGLLIEMDMTVLELNGPQYR